MVVSGSSSAPGLKVMYGLLIDGDSLSSHVLPALVASSQTCSLISMARFLAGLSLHSKPRFLYLTW